VGGVGAFADVRVTAGRGCRGLSVFTTRRADEECSHWQTPAPTLYGSHKGPVATTRVELGGEGSASLLLAFFHPALCLICKSITKLIIKLIWPFGMGGGPDRAGPGRSSGAAVAEGRPRYTALLVVGVTRTERRIDIISLFNRCIHL